MFAPVYGILPEEFCQYVYVMLEFMAILKN